MAGEQQARRPSRLSARLAYRAGETTRRTYAATSSAPAVKAANVKLAESRDRAGRTDHVPLAAAGRSQVFAAPAAMTSRYTSAQIGHEDDATLRVYAGATKRRERLSGPRLKAYDRALEWARMGTSGEVRRCLRSTREATKSPV